MVGYWNDFDTPGHRNCLLIRFTPSLQQATYIVVVSMNSLRRTASCALIRAPRFAIIFLYRSNEITKVYTS